MARRKRRSERDEEYEDEPRDDEKLDEEEEPEAEEDEDFDEEEEPEAEEDEEPEDDEEEEPEGDEDDAEEEVSAFEEEMHELQEDLGEDWIVRFSVKDGEAWLTAEKEDGSQHVEAATADVLREAVELLEEGGGGSS